MFTRFSGTTAFAVCCLASAAAVHAAPAPSYGVVDKVAGPDGGWDFANVDTARGVLYVARSNAVMAMDIASHTVSTLAPAQGSHQAMAIADGKTVVHDQEGTGLGWKPVAMVPAQAAALDTRCQMKRPP